MTEEESNERNVDMSFSQNKAASHQEMENLKSFESDSQEVKEDGKSNEDMTDRLPPSSNSMPNNPLLSQTQSGGSPYMSTSVQEPSQNSSVCPNPIRQQQEKDKHSGSNILSSSCQGSPALPNNLRVSNRPKSKIPQPYAKEAGILTEGGLSMIGQDFRKLTPAQLDQVLPKLQVLARSSPEDKHILVQRLNGALMPKSQEEWEEFHPLRDYHKEKDLLLPGYYDEWAASRNGVGEVVGVTGDGTNDGPALKAADVGLSMGISGTDVAKKASDIIIMDDNFSSIVKAVLWGRSVFDNIRKFLQFQLTVNVVALTITFVSAVAGYKPPLNAVMMLWVNLIMDTMGALALGTEPPSPKLLQRAPYKRDASLINYPMWRNILVQATYQLGLLIFLLKKGPSIFNCERGSTYHFTILFNAFVFCQIFNEFNARDIGDTFAPFAKLSTSPMFLFVVIVTVISQYAIVTYGGDFTQTHPLTASEWKITAGLGFVSIPIGYIMRQIPVDEDPDSFAGNASNGKSSKRQTNGLKNVIIILAPVIIAGGYQLLQMN